MPGGLFGYPSKINVQLNYLPQSLQNIVSFGNTNQNCLVNLTKFPKNLNTSLWRSFRMINGNSYFNLNSIAQSAPENGWTKFNSIYGLFNGGNWSVYRSYDTSQGSIATFMHKFPNIIDTSQSPFYSLSYTSSVTLFGDNDYFQITLTTTSQNQVWKFIPYSIKGLWYLVDWRR